MTLRCRILENITRLLLVLLLLSTTASAFSISLQSTPIIGRSSSSSFPSSSLFAEKINFSFVDNDDEIPKQQKIDSTNDSIKDRREFIVAVTLGGGGIASALIQNPTAANAAEKNFASSSPICVIGANGKTGSECVGACLARGIGVIATSRGGEYTGVYNDNNKKDLLRSEVCDVTVPKTIQSIIDTNKPRAIIFAASASKAGGTPLAVDNVGLVNVAEACIRNQVPHLVIVSSGAVSKPDSPVFKFLNIFGGIMEEKIKGEDTVRRLYSKEELSTYTVIRPGGLTLETDRGVGELELNQGDTKSGRISRASVASLCIESTMYPKLTGGTTFECYDADTSKPLGTVGLSNILKQKTSKDAVFVSGKERRGETFQKIFTGLEKDLA